MATVTASIYDDECYDHDTLLHADQDSPDDWDDEYIWPPEDEMFTSDGKWTAANHDLRMEAAMDWDRCNYSARNLHINRRTQEQMDHRQPI